MSALEFFQLLGAVVCVGFACFLSLVAAKNWAGDRYLCDGCKYNDPAACLKQERPKALDCAAYQPAASFAKTANLTDSFKNNDVSGV